jgi:hypothetical protein
VLEFYFVLFICIFRFTGQGESSGVGSSPRSSFTHRGSLSFKRNPSSKESTVGGGGGSVSSTPSSSNGSFFGSVNCSQGAVGSTGGGQPGSGSGSGSGTGGGGSGGSGLSGGSGSTPSTPRSAVFSGGKGSAFTPTLLARSASMPVQASSNPYDGNNSGDNQHDSEVILKSQLHLLHVRPVTWQNAIYSGAAQKSEVISSIRLRSTLDFTP